MNGSATVESKVGGTQDRMVVTTETRPGPVGPVPGHRGTARKIIVTISVALVVGGIVGYAGFMATRSTLSPVGTTDAAPGEDAYFKAAQSSAGEALADGPTANAAWWEAQAGKAYFSARNFPRGAPATRAADAAWLEAQAEKAYFRAQPSPRETIVRWTNGTAPNADIYMSSRGGQQR
jgi:hypothetical protein